MNPSLEPHAPPIRSEKIHSRHLERLAVVYVRQSTMQQVLDHQESTRLQYGLVGRAEALGWPKERILVIDDDLGKSGSSSEGRNGFKRLVAEVGLDHIGLILGIEMSRLARSNKDWHHLLEVCALFNTLIADSNGVYDANSYSDRLLLGLSGMMSEAELHILKQRMVQGKLNKARRGELGFPLPLGYVRRPSGEIVLDPDEQVQNIVRLIFRKFEELGTLNAVLRYLVKHNLQLGIRIRTGQAKGDLSWQRPNRMTLQNLLKNPMYAGAYSYGRRQVDSRKQRAGRPATGRVVTAPEAWHVLLKDKVPAYITWTQYEQNLARLQANRTLSDERGAVRQGAALLSGLITCGKCGCRMTLHYGRNSQRYRYMCGRQATDYGEPLCQSLAGPELDAYVSQQVLDALQPVALELSLAAAGHLEQERQDLDRLWQQRLERAAYEAERAARHYRLVEPENRLVARQLAKEWETELAEEQKLQEDYKRFLHSSPRLLSAEEQALIRQLSHNLPALWAAETSTIEDKKEIIRQVIERVAVDVQGESEKVKVSITWAGGAQTQGTTTRKVATLEQLSYYPLLCERIRALAQEGLGAAQIAQCLNEEGFKPPKRHTHFGSQGVAELMRRLDLGAHRLRQRTLPKLPEHRWWLADLAKAIGMPSVTLFNWLKRGWVTASRDEKTRRWVLWADETELARLKERYARPKGYYTRERWLEALSVAPFPQQ
jgi:DNA invertase Pin-like site-specific DNA recombinase